MNRREFSAGLIATGAATPAFANKDDVQLITRALILIQMATLVRTIQTMLILTSPTSALLFDLRREFNFRNDNRLLLGGLSKKRLKDEVRVAEPLGSVYLNQNQIVLYARRADFDPSVYTMMLGDNATTFLLGEIIRLNMQEAFRNIPALGNLPTIGRFFKAKRARSAQQTLLVQLTAKVVNPNDEQS